MNKVKYYILIGFLKEDQDTYHNKPGTIVSEVYIRERQEHILSIDTLKIHPIIKGRYLTAADQVKHFKHLINVYNKKYPEVDWKFFRGGSKNCPVEVDWTPFIKVRKKNAMRKKHGNSYKENLPLTLHFKPKKLNSGK